MRTETESERWWNKGYRKGRKDEQERVLALIDRVINEAYDPEEILKTLREDYLEECGDDME